MIDRCGLSVLKTMPGFVSGMKSDDVFRELLWEVRETFPDFALLSGGIKWPETCLAVGNHDWLEGFVPAVKRKDCD